MASYRQLKTPPIKEAIINVSFKDTIEIGRLAAFCKSPFIIEQYPRQNILNTIEIPNSPSQQPSPRLEGYVLNCGENCNKSIQIKIGQLSFHNTNIYIGWENFYNEFRTIWQIFCETVGKMDLINISVRYINELYFDLPLQNGFEEYITFLPTIPDGIRRVINNFFIQLNVPNDDNSMNGIMTETFLVPQPNKLQIILDLIVVKAQNFICNSDEMWGSFSSIRDFKNKLFFSCLTDKALLPYE